MAELDIVVGSARLPAWDDERSLLYIRALIEEVHRWGPIGSLDKHRHLFVRRFSRPLTSWM